MDYPILLASTLPPLLLAATRYLLRGSPLLLDTPPRIAASACAILILLFLTLCGPLPGAVSFVSYLLADLAAGLLVPPPVRAEMWAHHALCVGISAAGIAIMARGAPGERAAAESSTVTLLWMEGVNPFLHGLWLATREPALSGRVPRAGKGALAAALLALYAWLRVAGCARVAAAVWSQHWGVLGAPAPLYFALVAALSAMQVYWFGLLASMVYKGLVVAKREGGEEGGGGRPGASRPQRRPPPPLKQRAGAAARGGARATRRTGRGAEKEIMGRAVC